MSANDSAFPHSDQCDWIHTGLTKREYFAAMAMQGIFANSIVGDHHSPAKLPKLAVEAADALLAELGKPVQS